MCRQARVVAAVKALRKYLPSLGARKLQHQLAQWQLVLGRDQLLDILRANQLLIKPKRSYRTTTQSSGHSTFADLRFLPTAPNQLWVADITFLRVQHRFQFLALITDAYSRCIVGYHLAQDLSAHTALAALRQALTIGRCVPQGLVHHSDRGLQYTAHSYVQLLRKAGIGSSVSQHGSPYENPQAERINGILKQEFQLGKTFASEEQLKRHVHYAIFAYNCLRPHTACQFKTPLQQHLSPNPP